MPTTLASLSIKSFLYSDNSPDISEPPIDEDALFEVFVGISPKAACLDPDGEEVYKEKAREISVDSSEDKKLSIVVESGAIGPNELGSKFDCTGETNYPLVLPGSGVNNLLKNAKKIARDECDNLELNLKNKCDNICDDFKKEPACVGLLKDKKEKMKCELIITSHDFTNPQRERRLSGRGTVTYSCEVEASCYCDP